MSLTTEKRNCVEFLNVPRSYSPGEHLVVTFRWDEDFNTTSRDWIGLFRVGWTSSRDYYTFEWSQAPSEPDSHQSSVTFAGSRLPPEDSHFYQLCYVSRDGTVRGASAPFQFAPPTANLSAVEDLELVEVEGEGDMNSLMVVQRKSQVEEEKLRKEAEQAKKELGSVLASVSELKTEKKSLAGRVRATEMERDECKRRTAESEARARQSEALAQELQQKMEHLSKEARERQLRLEKALEQERAHSAELVAAKSTEDGELAQVTHRAAELEAENDDFQKQLQIKESQVEDLQKLVNDRDQECERLNVTIADLKREHAELAGREKEEREMLLAENMSLKQEVAVAQANVAELIGAREELVQQSHVPLPLAGGPLPPAGGPLPPAGGPLPPAGGPLPPAGGPLPLAGGPLPPVGCLLPVDVVDRTAYDALRQALETMEDYHKKADEEAKCYSAQLLECQQAVQTLEGNCIELRERLQRAKKEYEAKASECVELHRQIKLGGKLPDGEVEVARLRCRVEELERQERGLVQSSEMAVRELSVRMAECKELQVKVAQLEAELERKHEGTSHVLEEKDREIREKEARQQDALDEQITLVQTLQIELERLRDSHEQFQDKADRRIAEKNEELERQRIALDEKTAELAERKEQLDREKHSRVLFEQRYKQLKAHLDRTRASVGDVSARTCPVCETKFPLRMTQSEFEQHVNTHFAD